MLLFTLSIYPLIRFQQTPSFKSHSEKSGFQSEVKIYKLFCNFFFLFQSFKATNPVKLITTRNTFLFNDTNFSHVVRLFIACLQMGGEAGNKEQLRQRLREKSLLW